ncbi:MAG TPA: glycosyltransferase [Chitinophagaceae bacterium]|nr:glycosyltransferase [Chitinophagaceae bacterium]
MPTLSIIIPCYNEEKRLPDQSIITFLNKKEDTRIIFVDDGSKDNTLAVLNKLKDLFPARIIIIRHDNKKGKAEAVRTGLLESAKKTEFTHHGFIDADLSISPEELYRLFELLSRSEKKFILGSRIKKIGAKIIRNEWRHFYSRIIATIVGSIIKLDVYDTQCSAKVFQSELIPTIFNNQFKTKWLFDVEVICRININYGDLNKYGNEEPVLEWIEKKGSKLRWYNFFQIVKEVFVLRRNYRNKK